MEQRQSVEYTLNISLSLEGEAIDIGAGFNPAPLCVISLDLLFPAVKHTPA